MSAANTPKILMVDDEPNVLSGYQRTVGRTFSLTTAEGGTAGLKALESTGPFAVVVTDMRMPKMTGLEFLEAARAKHREIVFMMLTGNADQQTAVDAINRGHIFRFLNKPCAPEQLDTALRAALRQHELITAERVLLRETLTGTIKLLTDAIELMNPALAAIQGTIKQVHQDVCTSLGIKRDWQMMVASSLCLIGLVTAHDLKPGQEITDASLESASFLGHQLIQNLPRLAPVAAMILRQRDLGKLPADLKALAPADVESVGAQLLRFCVDVAREKHRVGSLASALQDLKASGGYDPRLIAAVPLVEANANTADKSVVQELPAARLQPGMELDADIRVGDAVLHPRGQVLSELAVASIRNYAGLGVLVDLFKVRVRAITAKAA